MSESGRLPIALPTAGVVGVFGGALAYGVTDTAWIAILVGLCGWFRGADRSDQVRQVAASRQPRTRR